MGDEVEEGGPTDTLSVKSTSSKTAPLSEVTTQLFCESRLNITHLRSKIPYAIKYIYSATLCQQSHNGCIFKKSVREGGVGILEVRNQLGQRRGSPEQSPML